MTSNTLLNLGGPTPHNIDWSDTAILLPMTGQDIGNYLGMSAEGVSRAFAGLVNSGAITKRSRDIAIIDMEQLECLVCSLT